MAWLEILPGSEALFRDFNSPSSFFSWTGTFVNRHRHRHVERVQLDDGQCFFAKKEFAVTWGDRFRNAWDGFGWCATAVREAAMLQAVRRAGIGCPEVVALGEDGRRAFLLTRAADDMTELRVLLPTLCTEDRSHLAEALGRELGRMHAAGFEHPDLYAKHILVAKAGPTFRVCILDWQRGRLRQSVPWNTRRRDLAVLDATLHPLLASDRLRLRCLRAYCRELSAPPLARLARRIRDGASSLVENRNIREIGQLPVPAGDQEFVAMDDGNLLIVRSYFDSVAGQVPDFLSHDSNPELLVRTWPAGDRAWEIPELAHTLFRLQRFGVAAPRLRAVGLVNDRVFVSAALPATVPLIEAIAKATVNSRYRLLREAGALVRKIHKASYCLPTGDSWAHRLGVTSPSADVVLVKIDSLQRTRASWEELGPLEFACESAPWSDLEQRWFLHGYSGTAMTCESERQAAG